MHVFVFRSEEMNDLFIPVVARHAGELDALLTGDAYQARRYEVALSDKPLMLVFHTDMRSCGEGVLWKLVTDGTDITFHGDNGVGELPVSVPRSEPGVIRLLLYCDDTTASPKSNVVLTTRFVVLSLVESHDTGAAATCDELNIEGWPLYRPLLRNCSTSSQQQPQHYTFGFSQLAVMLPFSRNGPFASIPASGDKILLEPHSSETRVPLQWTYHCSCSVQEKPTSTERVEKIEGTTVICSCLEEDESKGKRGAYLCLKNTPFYSEQDDDHDDDDDEDRPVHAYDVHLFGVCATTPYSVNVVLHFACPAIRCQYADGSSTTKMLLGKPTNPSTVLMATAISHVTIPLRSPDGGMLTTIHECILSSERTYTQDKIGVQVCTNGPLPDLKRCVVGMDLTKLSLLEYLCAENHMKTGTLCWFDLVSKKPCPIPDVLQGSTFKFPLPVLWQFDCECCRANVEVGADEFSWCPHYSSQHVHQFSTVAMDIKDDALVGNDILLPSSSRHVDPLMSILYTLHERYHAEALELCPSTSPSFRQSHVVILEEARRRAEQQMHQRALERRRTRQARLYEVQDRLAQLLEENKALGERDQQRQDELAQLRNELQAMYTAREKLVADYDEKLHKQTLTLEEKINVVLDMGQKLALLEMEAAQTHKQLQDCQQNLLKGNAELESTKDHLTLAEKQLQMEKEKQKSAPPAGALEDLEAENAKLSIRLDQTNSDMDVLKQAYERELAFKEEQLDKQQKQMSMEIEKLTSQSTHARHQVTELTQELSQLQTRYKTAVDEFERKETELKATLTREQAAHEITMNELRRSLAKVPTLLCVRTMQFSLC